MTDQTPPVQSQSKQGGSYRLEPLSGAQTQVHLNLPVRLYVDDDGIATNEYGTPLFRLVINRVVSRWKVQPLRRLEADVPPPGKQGEGRA